MRSQGENAALALWRLIKGNPRRFGGYVAHVGVLVAAVGIIASSSFKVDREFTLTPGETADVGGYTLRLEEVWGREEARRFVVGADVAVLKGSHQVATLAPRLNYYNSSEQPITTPAVRSRPHEDLYLTLMAFERDGSSASIRAMVEPLVSWIWIGGLIIGLGALISLRYRSRRADDMVVRQPGGSGRLTKEVVA